MKPLPDVFVKPRYDHGGFASLPEHISSRLTGGEYDQVVLFVVDGFGWRFFEKFQQEPFLRRVTEAGAEKLTSQFPSTTAAHITTIHSGETVGEHGVFEWNYYEPKVGAVISPLLFSFAGTMQRDTLKETGVSAKSLFPKHTLYHRLANNGVHASIFQHREYTPSTYSNILFRGATANGYRTLPEGLANLGEMLASARRLTYTFFYFDKIDLQSHEYGPTASQTETEALTFLLIMEHAFQKLIHPQGRTLFLLTADHGQVETIPAATIYLNTEPRFKGVEVLLRKDEAGNLIVPGGSCRDFFLYIQPGRVEEAQTFLASRLEGKAEVRTVEEMMGAGYFGETISPAFRKRAGDLVILPYAGEAVWWYEKDKFFQKYYGHHGGLTAQEMEIPLLTWEL